MRKAIYYRKLMNFPDNFDAPSVRHCALFGIMLPKEKEKKKFASIVHLDFV